MLRVALQARIQRAAHGLPAARQQLLRHLRRRRQIGRQLRTAHRHHNPQLDFAAGRRQAQLLRQGTGALRHHLLSCRRPAQQAGKDHRLAQIQSGRRLAEHAARRRAHALQLAAIGHQVQIRFDDLLLAPLRVQLVRGLYLVPLLAPAAAFGDWLQGRIEQGRELHGDGRRAARPGAEQVIPRRFGRRVPVHAIMLVEALIFRLQHRRRQRRRDIVQRHPRQAPHRHVDAQRLNRLAMPVQQLRVRRAIRRPHLVERWCRVDGAGQRQRQCQCQCQCGDDENCTLHFTLIGAFGIAPNISGLYIASTRVGGRLNWPGLFKRTVYSTLHLPFGTNW